jgi:hypothetical protein
MQTYRTTGCAAHGHPEVTLQLTRELPIPNIERLLLGYFEGAVARGTKFKPDQTVRVGWALLRLIERDDGTLGVCERELSPEVAWVEQVDRALHDTWVQREIVASVGLLDEIAFPSQDDLVMVSPCAEDGGEPVILMRTPVEDAPDFSGWSLSCAEEHEHGEPVFVPLLAVAANNPGLVQLLALPPNTLVYVSWEAKDNTPEGQRRIEPHVFRGENELVPADGSYLAALQE